MAWQIERREEHTALVTMTTNKANAQNPTFFADLHRAFDRLESEFRAAHQPSRKMGCATQHSRYSLVFQ